MYICLNCNYRSESHSNYCPNCGRPMATVVFEQPQVKTYEAAAPQETPAPAPQTPPAEPQTPPVTAAWEPAPRIPASVQYAPADPQPAAEPAPQVSVAKRVLSLVLAIMGILAAVYGMDPMWRFQESGRGYELYTLYSSLATCIFCIPGSLLGLLYANGNQKKGDSSPMCTISKILSFIGLGLAAYILYVGITTAITLL